MPRPPEGPSSRMTQADVPALTAEVKRLEKAVGSDKYLADDLAVARARLATADGRTADARGAWRRIIASREEMMRRWEQLFASGKICAAPDPAMLGGPVAEARCGLAEVEGDQVTLAKELPKVIAYHEARLALVDLLRRKGAYEPQETEEERSSRKLIRQARQRLDAVKWR